MQAIVLAGGKGARLRPYTTIFPKPLVPVGEQPIAEIIVRQLAACGYRRVVFAVSHLAGLIQAYFGDGRRWGLEISYSLEDAPLGTAGPIGMIEPLDENFLVMNGDVLTNLDFGALMRDHLARSPVATITTFRKQVPLSLGVLEVSPERRLLDYIEKPTMHYRVSMGIYVFNRGILGFLPRGQHLDLPDLMRRLIAAGQHVHCHEFDGEWLDIGRPEDYEEAQARYASQTGLFEPRPRD